MGQYQEAVSRSQGLRGAARMVGSIKQAAGFSWESRHHKYSPLGADYAGYSSEASADDGRLSGSSGGWAGEGGRLQKKQKNTTTHARKKKSHNNEHHPIREISASLLLLLNRRRRIVSTASPHHTPPPTPTKCLNCTSRCFTSRIPYCMQISPPSLPPSTLFIPAVSRSQKYRLLPHPQPNSANNLRATDTHCQLIHRGDQSAAPALCTLRGSVVKQSTVCIICIASHLSFSFFSLARPFFYFFLGHASLFPICHSLHHRAFTPVVGRRALISLLFIFLSMARVAGAPALTCSDSSDLHPSQRRELISAEVRKILPSSTFWKVCPKMHRFGNQ